MKDYAGVVTGIAFFVVVVGLAVLLDGYTADNDKISINSWAEKQGYEVVSVEKPWFDHPFWFTADEDDRIYKVTVRVKKTERRRVAYIRYGDFAGPEVRWRE